MDLGENNLGEGNRACKHREARKSKVCSGISGTAGTSGPGSFRGFAKYKVLRDWRRMMMMVVVMVL